MTDSLNYFREIERTKQEQMEKMAQRKKEAEALVSKKMQALRVHNQKFRPKKCIFKN